MALFSPAGSAAAQIREAASRGTLSHALLFTGGGDLTAAARYAAAALECQEEGAKPCGLCPACRKVHSDIHPDVLTVRDAAHKNIAVDVVRSVRADAYIRPNEGRRKVYIFPDCGLLTEQDLNVLLKIVEEGPPYAAFLFCAENASQVLQTLRSRCVELKPRPVAAEPEASPEAAETLLNAILRRKPGAAAQAAAGLEKSKLTREELAAALERCRILLAAALAGLYGAVLEVSDRQAVENLMKNLTKSQMIGTIEILEKYRGECAYNVGTGHVLGALAVELEGIL